MKARWLTHAGAIAVLGLGLAAQTKSVEAEVRVNVTAASGSSVFLDQGRASGIEPGDEVTLFPSGGGRVLARIRSVSRSNARAQLQSASQSVPRGTSGVIRVPKARLRALSATSTPARREVPEHPPWQQPFGEDDAGKPLLAPVSGRTSSERPLRIRGRTWLNLTTSWNRIPIRQQYSLGSVGGDFVASNPFGSGGEVHLRGDLSHRRVEFGGVTDDSTTRVRLDRLSFRHGHADAAPRRVQVGRFLQTMFPELGLVDGVEADTKISANQRIGISLGGFPEPYTSQATGVTTRDPSRALKTAKGRYKVRVVG